MKNWKYHLISLACLIGALTAVVAAPVVGGILLGAAIILEGIFWKRLFRRHKRAI
jgi:hypothetical protein